MTVMTGVRGDDGENEYRARLLSDMEQVVQEANGKYKEIHLSTYQNVIGGMPFSNGHILVTVCTYCGCIVYDTSVHDLGCP